MTLTLDGRGKVFFLRLSLSSRPGYLYYARESPLFPQRPTIETFPASPILPTADPGALLKSFPIATVAFGVAEPCGPDLRSLPSRSLGLLYFYSLPSLVGASSPFRGRTPLLRLRSRLQRIVLSPSRCSNRPVGGILSLSLLGPPTLPDPSLPPIIQHDPIDVSPSGFQQLLTCPPSPRQITRHLPRLLLS